VEEACSGIKTKQDTNLLSKTQNFGLMKTMGMGYKTKSGKILVRKYFTHAKADN
jgi:hypothetical protein